MRLFRVSLITLGIFFATSLLSQEISEDVEKCLKIHNNVERLACYDSAIKYIAPEGDAGDNDSVSRGWVFEKETDGFNEADVSRVFLDGVPPKNTSGEPNMRLYLACDGEGSFNVFVASTEFLGTRKSLRVRYRFDESEPILESWTVGTGGNGVWLPTGYRDFRSGLKDGSNLLFEITAFNGASYRSLFEDISQHSEKKEFVVNGCR